MEDKEKSIIFMALSNQILIYQSKLENHEYEDEIEKEIYKSIIEESMSLLDWFLR